MKLRYMNRPNFYSSRMTVQMNLSLKLSSRTCSDEFKLEIKLQDVFRPNFIPGPSP